MIENILWQPKSYYVSSSERSIYQISRFQLKDGQKYLGYMIGYYGQT